MDAEILQRRPMPPRPADPLACAQPQEQIELLREQLVVVVQIVAEERERLDERAAASHDLDAPAREQVERGELLEHAHRIVRAQHGDRAGETDAPGARGRPGQHHSGRGDREVRPVVLAHAEHVEPHLVGELDLREQLAQRLLRRKAGADRGERVDADLHHAPPARAAAAIS